MFSNLYWSVCFSSILDSLVAPLQERLEDWKKVVAQVDKDHAKGGLVSWSIQ